MLVRIALIQGNRLDIGKISQSILRLKAACALYCTKATTINSARWYFYANSGPFSTLQYVCSAMAVLLHYSFLCVFMWMLMEGIVLYVVLVRVFVKALERRYILAFTTASYGIQSRWKYDYILCSLK